MFPMQACQLAPWLKDRWAGPASQASLQRPDDACERRRCCHHHRDVQALRHEAGQHSHNATSQAAMVATMTINVTGIALALTASERLNNSNPGRGSHVRTGGIGKDGNRRRSGSMKDAGPICVAGSPNGSQGGGAENPSIQADSLRCSRAPLWRLIQMAMLAAIASSPAVTMAE